MPSRLHIICGMCGADKEFLSFKIDPTGCCDNDGNEYPGVKIYCRNCSSLTDLGEVLEERKE